MDVRDDLGRFFTGSGAADAFSELNSEAGWGALVGTNEEFAIEVAVEANPIVVGKSVVEHGAERCHAEGGIGFAVDESEHLLTHSLICLSFCLRIHGRCCHKRVAQVRSLSELCVRPITSYEIETKPIHSALAPKRIRGYCQRYYEICHVRRQFGTRETTFQVVAPVYDTFIFSM